MTDSPRIPKPEWLRKRIPAGADYEGVRRLVSGGSLHTVCQEARCPNIWECFASRTATFLIMGGRCTRNCRFCAVEHGPEAPPDPEEPRKVAEAVKTLGLRYAVVTSVTRDDLPDGGAAHFAATIREVRAAVSGILVEVLIPDLAGSREALEIVCAARPDVLNHNIETVPRLYPRVRPGADYRRSLDLLREAKVIEPSLRTKSGLMLGLGETDDELRETLSDLRAAHTDLLTLGQYLQPTTAHLPVERYVTPEAFEAWRVKALAMGFFEAASGPFVRSSYHAREVFEGTRP